MAEEDFSFEKAVFGFDADDEGVMSQFLGSSVGQSVLREIQNSILAEPREETKKEDPAERPTLGMAFDTYRQRH